MARFYGIIGFEIDNGETAPGVWDPQIVERRYTGDLMSNYIRTEQKDINDSVTLNNKFRLMADKYALEHISDIRYVNYLGTKWRVTNIEEASPRLIITVGGVYNENED